MRNSQNGFGKKSYDCKKWIVRGDKHLFKIPCEKRTASQIWTGENSMSSEFYVMGHKVHRAESIQDAIKLAKQIITSVNVNDLSDVIECNVIMTSSGRALYEFYFSNSWNGNTALFNLSV